MILIKKKDNNNNNFSLLVQVTHLATKRDFQCKRIPLFAFPRQRKLAFFLVHQSAKKSVGKRSDPVFFDDDKENTNPLGKFHVLDSSHFDRNNHLIQFKR